MSSARKAIKKERTMRKLLVTLTMVGALAGCTTAEQGAVVGGLGGAAIGGLATGRTSGALAGGLIGATAGYLIGRSANRPGYCRYRDQYGRVYEARCR
jgi:predicted lipid-binding transport protein (Tim44 family)